jgi:AsmA-like C-terminal region/Protein of unknown function
VTRTVGGNRTGGAPANRTSNPRTRGRSRTRARRHMLPLLAKMAGAAVFAAIVTAGLLYVRLMHGPIALNFLAHTFESGIAEELLDAGVQIETVALRLNDNGLLQFELGNVRVTDATGEPLVMAPSAAVSLSRRALLRGRLAIESLDLVSARLTLFYSEEGTLSLKFAQQAPAIGSPVVRGTVPIDSAEAPGAALLEGDWALGRIDLVKALSEASARARRREHVGAYLREIGLRSATVVIDNGTRKSIWRVPEFDLDLDHRRSRSSIAGRIKIESLAGPWELNFRSREHVNAKSLNLAVSIQGLVPRGLARSFPQLVGLEGLDVPLWGDANLEVSNSGDILGGKIVLDAAPGHVTLPWLAVMPMRIDGAHVEMSYDGAARRFDIAPSVLSWGDSRLQFTGAIAHAQGPDGEEWKFDIKSSEGWLAAEPPDLQRLPIDQLAVRGSLVPEHGRIVLDRFLLKAGGAEITANGDASDVGGALKGQIDARIGPMPAVTFKTLWPGWIAPASRSWMIPRLARGNLLAGHFKVIHGSTPAAADRGPPASDDRVSLVLEGANLELALVEGWPTLDIPRGMLRLEGKAVEFTIPDGSMTTADGKKLSVKGSLTVDLDEPLPRTGQLALKCQGPLTAALQLLDQDAVQSLQNAGLTLAGMDGKLDANLNVKVPLSPQLNSRDAVVEGMVRVSDGKIRNVLGSFEAHAVNLVLDLSAAAADGRAEFLIKGAPARASWQRVFDAPADKQPPLRITASLDNSERMQLGLDLNDIVQGEVGVEITIGQGAQGERDVHVRADLSNAELVLESLAWRKPKGRPSLFEFDLVRGTVYPNELRNVKLVGENVAIAGWMGAGTDFRIREFRFPQFSVNVVTSLEAHGKLRSDNVWEVVARGPIYDGKELFQSFFDVNLAGDRSAKGRPGVDLRAEIDTVVGFYDTSLRGVTVSMQRRGGKLTMLDARGVLPGNKQFDATMRHEPGRPRLLTARSADAGQTFKLVGFYPHAVGGEMNLSVNLDGQGAAERIGTLTATRFHVLGDAISVQNFPGSETAARRNVVRERFEFNTLKAPFSVGHGQFVLHSAAIEGPLVSATMRGKVDFRTRTLQVGGTFTPLSTLNKLFSEVPLFGDIVTGPRREGVFAMTYALQGGLENPELVVNPFSAITPGITRELMQITPDDPRVVPRKQPAGKNEKGTRASGSPALGPQSNDKAQDAGGWSSEVNQPATKKR